MKRHPKQRSAVSNGTRMFLTPTPGNSEAARRFGDLVRDLIEERGGPASLGVTVLEGIRTYAGIAVRLEQLHAEIASGADVDPETLGQLGDRLARQARLIGPPKTPARASLRERHEASRNGRTA